jgi:hypothetical protein
MTMRTALFLVLAYLAGWRYGDRLAARVGDWFHRTIWGPLGLGGLALVAALPLAAQAADTTVVCTQCVKDSTVSIDSVATWEVFTRINYTYRDSLIITPKRPPVAASCPNLPAGYAVVSERSFGSPREDGWTERKDPARLLYLSDATGPRSAPGIARALYPVGFAGGSGPVRVDRAVPQRSGVFLCFWIRLSPNWVGHPTNVNKVFHLWIAGQNKAVVDMSGAGRGPFRLRVTLQNGYPTASRNLASRASTPAGTWARVEVELLANTPGQEDGRARWWVDGQLAGDYAVGWLSPTQRGGWSLVSWNPTWGGVGGTIAAPQWMDLDHIVVAVR